MIFLTPLPFLIEVLGDWILIGLKRKDIPLWARVAMIVVVWIIGGKDMALLASAPFAFFDPALNILRGKKWDYTGQTKKYDLWLARFNPRFVLTVRIILFVSSIILAWILN